MQDINNTYSDTPPPYPAHSQAPGVGNGIDFAHHAHILMERLWVAITVVAVVMAAVYFYSGRKVPMFRSTTRIQMDVPRAKVVERDDVVDMDTRDYAFLQTQVKILESHALAKRVVESLGLLKNPRFVPRDTPLESAASRVVGSTSVSVVSGTRMVDITVVHPDPDITATLANGVASCYLEQNLNQRMASSLEALEWLRAQAETYKSRLEKSELALQEYRERTLSTSLVDQKNGEVLKLQTLNSELTAIETRRLTAETEWKMIQDLVKAGKPLESSELINSSPLVENAQSAVLQKQTQVGVLRSRYKGEHPALQLALRELEELRQQLQRATAGAIDEIKNSYEVMLAKEQALRRSVEEQKKVCLGFDRKLMAYNELLRDVEADRQLYESILARMKETSVAGSMETNNVRIVDPARVPKNPFNINQRKDLLQALMISLVMGIGLCYLAHYADDRIKRTEDMEQGLGLPVLAVVPRIADPDAAKRARIVFEDRHSAPAEAFRTLRASIGLSPTARKAHVLMVTSARPGAGKSLVSSNLAISMAQNGVRTLLVDADLRRPTVHRGHDVDMSHGLSRALADESSWRDAVCATEIPNLHIIPAGPIPPNPAELLGSQALTNLLRGAAEEYDKIILDTPPVFGLSDPLVLLPQVQGVIFVAEHGRTLRRAAAAALQKLSGSETPIIGGIINNVNIKRPSGYYYYRYSSDYYGTYGNRGKGKS